jgi:hypothetical protein
MFSMDKAHFFLFISTLKLFYGNYCSFIAALANPNEVKGQIYSNQPKGDATTSTIVQESTIFYI